MSKVNEKHMAAFLGMIELKLGVTLNIDVQEAIELEINKQFPPTPEPELIDGDTVPEQACPRYYIVDADHNIFTRERLQKNDSRWCQGYKIIIDTWSNEIVGLGGEENLPIDQLPNSYRPRRQTLVKQGKGTFVEGIALEMAKADKKHGRMEDKIEGFFTVKCEVTELEKEAFRPSERPLALANEALQVATMGLKYLDDICGFSIRDQLYKLVEGE